MMWKNPGFTAIAVLTLALGIGANTAIFSVVNAVLLQPLPYAKADELVAIWRSPGGDTRWPFSPPSYLELKNHNTVFTEVAAMSNKGWPANLTDAGEPERLQGYQVSANLFPLLGATAAQGRTFTDEEDRPGANHVVVVSNELWRRRFNADPAIVGQSLRLNGEPYTVVGVMPADFRYFTKTDMWTPLAFTAADENDQAGYLVLIGRRKPGVTVEQAATETDTIVGNSHYNQGTELHARLDPPQAMFAEEVRPLLLLLLGAVGFVLLIACVNIANLLLARGSARRRELAIRSALGAGRWRVARQLLAESLVLALCGGAAGLLIANWTIEFVAGGLPDYLSAANARVATLHIDSTALAFAMALALLTSLLFGFAPALQLSKIDLNGALKDGGRTAGSRSRLRSALVVAEVALAMVLLVGGGLMIKSFWRMSRVNLGYEPAGVLTAKIDPSGERYESFDGMTTFYQDLLERVRAIPGVSNAGYINSLNASFGFSIDEHPPLPPGQEPSASINQVSAGYFNTMGIPLRAGRFLDDHDVRASQPVVVVDETFARTYFPDEDPLGKHINNRVNRGQPGKSYEIVGVVGAVKYWTVTGEPQPHIYYSYLQENWWSMELVARTASGDPARLATPIRTALAAIDPNQPIHSFKAQEANVAEMVAPQRFTTLLLAGFAALAAGLAAIGLYGVIAYMVTQRTREIGIRMALGASHTTVMRMVIRQGMALAVIGIAIGLAASFALTRLLESMLYGTSTTDPVTFVAIAILLAAVALAACFIPALRATRVDPMAALRYE
jgi:putative ABC transport system permease protein